MLTQTEIKKILDSVVEQVNKSFEQDRKRLDKLEAQIAALEDKSVSKSPQRGRSGTQKSQGDA